MRDGTQGVTMARGRSRHALVAPAVAAIVTAFLITGCGFGPGQDRGSAEVVITRDYGRVLMYEGRQSVRESDDAMRLLARATDSVETRYGGGFVESIDGYGSGADGDGSATDWFFYLDGEESPVGALDAEVEPGQTVWWDRRDWSAAMHVPAVVGSWPQPFESTDEPVGLECLRAPRRVCSQIQRDLEDVGAEVRRVRAGEDPGGLRILVGPWSQLRRDSLASKIEAGPAESGVYARFTSVGGRWLIQPLDRSADESGRPVRGGLVAALSREPGEVTWIVTGTDEDSLPGSLVESVLERRYAVLYPTGNAGGAREVPSP